MPGFMGTLVSGAAAAFQGQELIAELEQKKASTENQKADAQFKQMQVLQEKQKLEGAKDVGEWMRANATADAQQGKDGVQQLQRMTVGADAMLMKGDMAGYELMQGLIKSKSAELKDLHVAQETAKSEKLETLAQAALQFQAQPTPELGEQLVKSAVAAGENPVNIPKPNTPQFASWAKNKQTAAMSSSDNVKFQQTAAEKDREYERKVQDHKDHEEDVAASRAQTASNQAISHELARARLDDARAARADKSDEKESKKADAKSKVQFNQADKIITETKKEADPYLADLRNADYLTTLLADGGSSAKDEQIREALTSLHKGTARSTALFYRNNKSFGATDDKLASFLSHGLTGRYGDEDRRQIYELAQTVRDKYVQPALARMEKDAQDRGAKFDIPAEMIKIPGDWSRAPAKSVAEKGGKAASGPLLDAEGNATTAQPAAKSSAGAGVAGAGSKPGTPPSKFLEGDIITNPKTGETMVRKDGKWVKQ